MQITGTDPHVKCDDTPAPSYASCRSVLDTIPWDRADGSFGPDGHYSTPFLIASRGCFYLILMKASQPILGLIVTDTLLAVDHQCVAQIMSNGAASTARWADIFTAIAQVDEICVKNGRSGHAYHIGM